jgi:hypothetical protein
MTTIINLGNHTFELLSKISKSCEVSSWLLIYHFNQGTVAKGLRVEFILICLDFS